MRSERNTCAWARRIQLGSTPAHHDLTLPTLCNEFNVSSDEVGGSHTFLLRPSEAHLNYVDVFLNDSRR